MESLLTPYHTSEPPAVRSVLVLAPHPDDEVFGCGGTLALHVAAGTKVHVVVVTGGQAGGDEAVRHAESLEAARVLGYAEPDFWGLPDRSVQYGEALVQRILRTIALTGAEVVYAPSLWENHPDHRAVALAALEAVRRDVGCALMSYEVGAPLRPNRLVDITTVRSRKKAAMASFPSQLVLQRYDAHIDALNVFRSYTLSSSVEVAEAFEYNDAASLKEGRQAFLQSEYLRQRERGLMLTPADAALVSVLIRSVDRPELERALASVAAQTWPRIEVVVVNAKGLGHRELPSWCGRFPLRFIDGEARLHRSAAANLAIDSAQGDNLVFLDDDDWLDADHVHKLASALAARADAVAAVTGAVGIDAQGHRCNEWRGDAGMHRLMLANQMPIMSVLFRRPSAGNTLRFDEALNVFEDWDFWLQLSSHGAFAHVPGISANYMIRLFDGSGVHDDGVSRIGLARIRAKWRGRWPDAWFEAVRDELDGGTHQMGLLAAQVAQRDAEVQRLLQVFNEREIELAQLRPALRAAEEGRALAVSYHATMEHQRNLSEHYRSLAEQHRVAAEHERSVAQQQRDAAVQQQGAAQQQHAETQRRLESTEQQRVDMEYQRNALVRELSATREAAHAERQQAALALQGMHQSHSWRATAPLRVAGRWFRSFTRR